jgi:hypothetical protein
MHVFFCCLPLCRYTQITITPIFLRSNSSRGVAFEDLDSRNGRPFRVLHYSSVVVLICISIKSISPINSIHV